MPVERLWGDHELVRQIAGEVLHRGLLEAVVQESLESGDELSGDAKELLKDSLELIITSPEQAKGNANDK